MAFKFTEQHLESMFSLSSLSVPDAQMVFFALRGCSPIDDNGTEFSSGHELEVVRVDHHYMNCTIGQWMPGRGIAVFPGSTVPYFQQVAAAMGNAGRGVNMLALGYYRDDHSYCKGDHGLSNPQRRHRAFRNDSPLPVWRTSDDDDYDGDDELHRPAIVYDNIHCAWQLNIATPKFSSNGCQVVAGMPAIAASGTIERGPWAKFVANAYGIEQRRFNYALFSGHEALKTAELGAERRYRTVRFGSRGPEVSEVQQALLARGYDLGPAGVDGDCGFATISAVKRFQRDRLGPSNADAVVGPATAAELGLDWSSRRGPVESGQPASNAGVGGLASDGVDNPKYGVKFTSLVPGGFFSSDPDDLAVKRSIRTNNPGALNISSWQRSYPGFVGVTQDDGSGNKTTIYRTPEHGVGAWYHLLSKRYGFEAAGSIKVGKLAAKYAGTTSENSAAARNYVAGWKAASGNTLSASTVISLADSADVLRLARAMFHFEIGARSPLSDMQIADGIRRERDSDWP